MERLSFHNRVVWVNRYGRKNEPLLPGSEQVTENLSFYYPGCKFIPDRLIRGPNDGRRLLQTRLYLKRIGFTPDIVWTHDPYSRRFIHHFGARGAVTLYYCNDIFGEGKHRLEEAKIARAVDLIMVTSPNLYQRLGYTGKAHLMMHGVDEFTRYDFPYRKEKLKTVGYVGTIRDCLDLELLREIARGGRYRLVMAGPVIEMDRFDRKQKEEWDDFLRSPAVDYLGPLPRQELRKNMAQLDLLLMPYDVSLKSELSFPQKFFEYLSVGRPILATDFFTWPESLQKFVHVYRSGENINDALESAWQAYNEEHYRAAIELAYGNTWGRRLGQISSLIEERLAARAAENAAGVSK
jgi:glycosyltransferase involved in cell wall biosynthesis